MNTHTVKTADGKINKVWEFNLPFRRGKPVIVGAGMQGSRASIVFANQSEISAFIHADCPE